MGVSKDPDTTPKITHNERTYLGNPVNMSIIYFRQKAPKKCVSRKIIGSIIYMDQRWSYVKMTHLKISKSDSKKSVIAEHASDWLTKFYEKSPKKKKDRRKIQTLVYFLQYSIYNEF